MKLYIYNTLERKKVEFFPINKNHVGIYVCGPTVYDDIHIGNARPLIVFDILVRVLRQLFPKVTYVRNITDIDDKINERAKNKNISINDLCNKTIKDFHEVTKFLNVLPPDQEPRATENINGMIKIINKLIKKKFAYQTNGHVFFSVKKMQDYGLLSKKNREEMIAGARVEISEFKTDPEDFVLWKPSEFDLPGWESPWGRGRPGWHIECSAMSEKYLGKSFDIHGGGLDLVFPHHENEIAQSCCANDTNFMAKYWVHNGYLVVEGKKMSKSLGNFLTVSDALKKNKGEVIRYCLLSTHYRSPLDFSAKNIIDSKNCLDSLYRAFYNFNFKEENDNIDKKFMRALLDDLNTPKALSILHNFAGDANKGNLKAAKQLKLCGSFLGFFNDTDWFKSNDQLNIEINNLIKDRTIARDKKDFKKADEIRKTIEGKGFRILDEVDGTKVEKK